MFLGVAVDNMEIYYIILGTIFFFVFLGWLGFQSGAFFKMVEVIGKDVDKND